MRENPVTVKYPIKLSIVITTRNRASDLTECLTSISNSLGIAFDFEVIVVDDASTDATSRMNSDSFAIKNLSFVRNASQSMMVRTRNKGGRLAKGELVLFVDDDNVLAPDMIAKLVQFADRHPDYAIIGPKMCYYPSKKPYLSFQKINFFTGKTTGGLDTSGAEYLESDGIPNVFMVRKVTLERCGYFDEAIVQTYTEPDLAFSARRLGYKCAMVQTALTFHRIPETGGAILLGGNQFRQKAFFLMRNRTVMIVRYGRWYQQGVYLLMFSWLWPMLYSVLVLPERRFDLIGLYWAGFWDGLKYFLTRKLTDPDLVISRLRSLFGY
jgi:GT2 family glycosyltransferase